MREVVIISGVRTAIGDYMGSLSSFSAVELGIMAGKGVLEKAGIKVQRIFKINEGRPNTLDYLINKKINLVINTPTGQTPRADEVKIRTTAVYTNTPIMTTLSGAKAAALGIEAMKRSGYTVQTLQEYHNSKEH